MKLFITPFDKYRKIDLKPILPSELILFKLATPLTIEKKTIGTTNILIVFKKISPPKFKRSSIIFSKLFGSLTIDKVIPNKIPKKKP